MDLIVGEGRGSTATVLFLLLVGAAVLGARWLRSVRPWLWWPLIGAPVATWRLARSWRSNCDELDLSIPGGARLAVVGGGGRGGGVILKGKSLRVVAPRPVKLWYSGCALMLTVRLHPGQTPGQ